jgi:two-component system, LytTR family, sensor histidine kinase AlgZ
MNKPRSIKQNAYPDALPDFRNMGVALRILLLSNAFALFKAVIDGRNWTEVLAHLIGSASLLTPVLLSSLLLLWLVQPVLKRLSYAHASLAISLGVMLLTLAIFNFSGDLFEPVDDDDRRFDAMQYALLAILVSQMLLFYFRWRAQVLSQALHDARLQVLRARIRPHFLFNTINAVLSIVRKQPKQAETALEDMADLFRMAMSEAQDLVPLRQELKLSEQYLALEKLRLGERLRLNWQIDAAAMNALLPPLLLQPLLENAVYHGIETLAAGGIINIGVRRAGKQLELLIANPCQPSDVSKHVGNQLALKNIRERLELLFDVEARYAVEAQRDAYKITITLPYLQEGVV